MCLTSQVLMEKLDEANSNVNVGAYELKIKLLINKFKRIIVFND